MDALRGMKLVFREKPQLIIPKKLKEGGEKEGEAEGGKEKEKEEEEGGKVDEGEKGEDWKAVLDLSDEDGKKKQEETSADKKVCFSCREGSSGFHSGRIIRKCSRASFPLLKVFVQRNVVPTVIMTKRFLTT